MTKNVATRIAARTATRQLIAAERRLARLSRRAGHRHAAAARGWAKAERKATRAALRLRA